MKTIEMKTIIAGLISIASIALTGCNPLDGTLHVNSALTVVEKNGDVTNIGTGDHEASIDPSSSKLKLTVVKRRTGEKVKAYLDLPRGFDLPERGRFTLLGRSTGQRFDLEGNVAKSLSVSGPYSVTESCTVNVEERVCHDQRVVDQWGRVHYKRVCERRVVARSGRRHVVYHFNTTTTVISADLLQAGGNAVDATFTGSRTDSSKVYDRIDACYLY